MHAMTNNPSLSSLVPGHGAEKPATASRRSPAHHVFAAEQQAVACPAHNSDGPLRFSTLLSQPGERSRKVGRLVTKTGNLTVISLHALWGLPPQPSQSHLSSALRDGSGPALRAVTSWEELLLAILDAGSFPQVGNQIDHLCDSISPQCR